MKSPSQVNSFLRRTEGNVAPFFGLMVIPMLAITGGAIDMNQAVSTKSRLQNALDAAAVAVCGGGNGQQSTEEIIRAYLGAELADSGMTLLPPPEGEQTQGEAGLNEIELQNAEFNPADGSLSPKMTIKVPTKILSLIGINDIDIEVESEVMCGAKRLELSLVLDVTGSMANSVSGKAKIDSMKEAGLDVLDIFERNLDAGVTRISLVPFSEAVNVGSYANSVRGTIQSGTSTSVGKSELKFRDYDYDWKYYDATSCVSERLGSHAYKDTAPGCSGSYCSAPVGHVYTSNGSCRPGNVLQPLTTDKNSLRQQILSYQPNGGTAGHIGTAWGWYTVSNKWSGVFTGNAAPEPANPDELIKATIIMTDGEFNEQYRNGVDDDYTSGSANNGSSNNQFEQICEAMKDPDGDGVYDDDDSVVVYTVGFGLSESSNTAQRLKDCASDDTKYFFPYNGEELRAAFQSIGKQLSGGQVGKAVVRQ